jgi:hypothetical protein
LEDVWPELRGVDRFKLKLSDTGKEFFVSPTDICIDGKPARVEYGILWWAVEIARLNYYERYYLEIEV